MSELTQGVTVSGDPGAGFGLAGKVAIVTGAASGIGRAAASLLAQCGAIVTAVDVNAKGFAGLDLGKDGSTDTADLSVPAACDQVVAGVLKRHKRLDILVNAAAILRRVSIKDTDAALWEQMMDTNLLSQFAMCRAAARPMREQKSGSMVLISSTAAFNGGADNSSVYAIGKGGVLALGKSLARQLASYGVTVNVVAPGGIDTPMGRFGFTDESWNAHYQKNVPLRRAGQPEEVAKAILFLVSDWASYITGHTLDVEGGLMLR